MRWHEPSRGAWLLSAIDAGNTLQGRSIRYEKNSRLVHLRREGTIWGYSHHLETMQVPVSKPIILDEDCAPRRVLELFSVKWTTVVLHALHFHGGTCRTGALARSLPGCSKKMLTQTLREMERDGLIDRKVYPVVPPMVEYSLTPMGRLFIEPIEMLYAWAAKNDDALSKLRRRRKKHTASSDKARKAQ
jgi:DNA-binding HxlR family transcriptional regulator